MDVGLGVATEYSRTARPARPAHLACVSSTQSHCVSATETLNYKEFAPSQNWANDWGPENDLLKFRLRIEISG